MQISILQTCFSLRPKGITSAFILLIIKNSRVGQMVKKMETPGEKAGSQRAGENEHNESGACAPLLDGMGYRSVIS
jgi:hypothetical protein